MVGDGGESVDASRNRDGSMLLDGALVEVDAGGVPTDGGGALDDAGASPDASTDDELSSLPRDTGGTHTAHPLGTTDAEFGYYVYLPGGYEDTTRAYPLLVFLHGKGERGDGIDELDRVLRNGPPKIIEADAWAPTHPMIVASRQYYDLDEEGNENNWGEGHPEQLKGYIEYLMSHYRVNALRIYLTGLSHGGNGVFDYLVLEPDSISHLAAAAPIAAWGAGRFFERARNTPIWVFVGSADGGNFTNSLNFVTRFNALIPAPMYPARFSVYAGAGHDVWTRTYNLSGMGTADPDYDPYDMSLYDWMLQYERTAE